MSNREYWIKRMQHREAVSYTNGLEATAGLLRQYKKTAAEIRREINDFYARYAGENGLTFEQAMREMSRADLREWRGTVGDYIRQIQREPNPQIRERLMREYDARSYNSRISRLDGLCGNIEMNINNLYARADEQFRQLLGEEYTGGYYRAMYDIQTRLGYNGQFSAITREMVENTLAYPWSGANFSDRLWRNKTALVDTIRETLTQGMIRGDNIREMSRAVADSLNSSYRNAERLVRTETSHIHNTAEIAAYEAAGYEEYEFMASLGERTCEVCGGLDGQHFKIADIQYGVNFPPVHPNCRCTTVGWEPEEEELPEGEQQEKLSYEDWYGKYVEGREQELIAEHQTAPALIAPTVDGREVVLTGSGDFLAFRRVDGLTDEQVSDIINSKRAKKIPENRPNWQRFSLTDTIRRLAPGAEPSVPTEKGKVSYKSTSSPFEIVYDSVFDYFRIVDTRISGTKNVFVDINGNKADNYFDEFGKQHGRLRPDYQKFTHYDNTDYRKGGENV
jgi:SPP1 gp7 family putative phage head morphogenesis protein